MNELDKQLNIAKTHIIFKKITEAESVYKELCYQYIDYRPWLGLLELLYITNVDKNDERYQLYLQQALSLCKDTNERQQVERKCQERIDTVSTNTEEACDDDSDEYYELGMNCKKNKEFDNAYEHFKTAVENGSIKAIAELGYCYFKGYGVEIDYQKAIHYYEIAANHNDKVGQRRLGYCYDEGFGVKKDYKKAVYWYEKAAMQGDCVAQNNLAICYELGCGVAVDYDEAIRLYKLSAESGYATAQYNLGESYRFGAMVEKDAYLAAYWYVKAAEQGHEKSKEILSNITFN